VPVLVAIERLEHDPAGHAPRDPSLNHNRRALMQHSAPGSARHRCLGIAVFAQARRRGALAEARVHLTKAFEQLRGIPAGSERDRLGCGLRLERGHLAGLVDGYQRPQVMFPMGESSASGSRCVMIFTAQSLASTTFIGTIPSQSIRIACS
jgi:hypothetical protein